MQKKFCKISEFLIFLEMFMTVANKVYEKFSES